MRRRGESQREEDGSVTTGRLRGLGERVTRSQQSPSLPTSPSRKGRRVQDARFGDEVFSRAPSPASSRYVWVRKRLSAAREGRGV